jgi:hypothetical protein
MKRIAVQENTRTVLATTVVLWAAGVAMAAWEGVFAKLSPTTFALLVAFALLYAAAGYSLDRGLRAVAAASGVVILWAMALAADAILIATAVAVIASPAPALEALSRFPHAISALFVAPMATVLHLAAMTRATRRVSSTTARSPGAKPAAT